MKPPLQNTAGSPTPSLLSLKRFFEVWIWSLVVEVQLISEADGPALTFKGTCVTRMPAEEVLCAWLAALDNQISKQATESGY